MMLLLGTFLRELVSRNRLFHGVKMLGADVLRPLFFLALKMATCFLLLRSINERRGGRYNRKNSY